MQKISAGKFHFEPPSRVTSLDHLIGQCQQFVGYFEAERLRSLEVDHKLEFGGLHHRKISRLLALEYSAGIDAGLAVRIGYARSVAHQPAGLDRFAPGIDRSHRVACSQRGQPLPTGVEERADTDEQRTSPALDERCKSCLNVAVAAGFDNDEFLSERSGRSLQSLRSLWA